MKKNIIATLLVLALGSIAISAAVNSGSSSFDVSTEVNGLSYLAVTSSAYTGQTVGEWNSFIAANGITSAVDITNSPLAYINLVNNKRTGVNVYMYAEKMTGSESANTYVIDYEVSVNNATYNTSTSTSNELFVSAANSQASEGIFFGSYPVSASVDQNSFDNAPEDTYTGTIYFTFSAT
ncbi:hypothetical protein [Sphaerochaeta halotolerans]|uniref:hypothetical protein n=1 Tax=Sphaerochaeta halotolerans TaxID=2293840 RepID=UPI0013680C22|nr:hypothetical protein [Sphaerochaeta halotolerans]MXI86765.1 hypothetical protein [Sphaerochaeta halotolerans]